MICILSPCDLYLCSTSLSYLIIIFYPTIYVLLGAIWKFKHHVIIGFFLFLFFQEFTIKDLCCIFFIFSIVLSIELWTDLLVCLCLTYLYVPGFFSPQNHAALFFFSFLFFNLFIWTCFCIGKHFFLFQYKLVILQGLFLRIRFFWRHVFFFFWGQLPIYLYNV